MLNGQKVWTSYAQFADWGWCLARTDPDAPKSKGISALVVDMHAPGVEVRPLRQITDESEFNEVFFTDVFVPADQLVGPLNEGWRIANSTLTHERGVNPRQLVIHSQLVDELWRLALERGAFDDPRLAPRLAQAFVEVRMFQLHNWRSISRTAKGEDPGPVGSINKLWWSEMSKRLHDTAMAVVGPAQPLWRGADDNPGDGAWQRSWLYYQASSIWAGTNEIQRNVVGRTGARPPARTRPDDETLNDRRARSYPPACARTTSAPAPWSARSLSHRVVARTRVDARCCSSGSSSAAGPAATADITIKVSTFTTTLGEGGRDGHGQEQRHRHPHRHRRRRQVVRQNHRPGQGRHVHRAVEAGTYQFHCNIHTTMHGTLTVVT